MDGHRSAAGEVLFKVYHLTTNACPQGWLWVNQPSSTGHVSFHPATCISYPPDTSRICWALASKHSVVIPHHDLHQSRKIEHVLRSEISPIPFKLEQHGKRGSYGQGVIHALQYAQISDWVLQTASISLRNMSSQSQPSKQNDALLQVQARECRVANWSAPENVLIDTTRLTPMSATPARELGPRNCEMLFAKLQLLN